MFIYEIEQKQQSPKNRGLTDAKFQTTGLRH